jgi:hypothetical protein
MSEAMYKAASAQAGAAAGPAGSEPSGGTSGPEDDAIDAEFEVKK